MSAAAAEEKRVITLMTTDGGLFQVEDTVAMMSQTIKHIIQDDCDDHAITLPDDFTRDILAKVIQYCKKHHEPKDDCDGLKNWNADFVKVDQDTLFDLIMAAYYLNIRELLDLTYRTGADVMKGKTLEQVRQSFNVKNDYNSPEEGEEEIRRENEWALFE